MSDKRLVQEYLERHPYDDDDGFDQPRKREQRDDDDRPRKRKRDRQTLTVPTKFIFRSTTNPRPPAEVGGGCFRRGDIVSTSEGPHRVVEIFWGGGETRGWKAHVLLTPLGGKEKKAAQEATAKATKATKAARIARTKAAKAARAARAKATKARMSHERDALAINKAEAEVKAARAARIAEAIKANEAASNGFKV